VEIMTDGMGKLIEMSHRYGGDARYVLAGGGNTSFKSGGVLYVKASGTRLSTIEEPGFVKMDMGKLSGMFEKPYPEGDKQREAEALQDMMDARLPGESMRPSVECMLHGLFPPAFVLHLHPALVNGLTCGTCGRQFCEELFGDGAVWVPLTKPGYTLAKACHDLFEAQKREYGTVPNILFMQNHGVIVAADTAEEIDVLIERVMDTIGQQAGALPDFTPQAAPEGALNAAPALRMLYRKRAGKACAVFHRSDAVLQLPVEAIRKPFNPDQIVYCKAAILELEPGNDVPAAFKAFVEKHGYAPKIAVMHGAGVFALGKAKAEADTALSLFLDAAKIAYYARGFGGPLTLPDDFTNFILEWEVENYRQKMAFAAGNALRMDGKICVVTGAAQGFGEGIARAIAAQGGYVIAADLNLEGAKAVAASLCQTHGDGAAVALQVNVAEEASVKQMVNEAVTQYGGVDVMVSCAGILIAGDLAALTLEQFEKVTKVNYTGYYLCAKHAAAVMKRQREADPETMADIIEINSKSGLEGSKANFAYAGSKFGGIGLTQSFALELAPYGIKVNAVCPGNLLDGPLWSDPERGLFRQYLDAKKVPGAKTVDDVRRFYEAKVPLGRGCTEEDVARAIFYLVEQQYETGQALPVTGGQVMLN
jgi:NAD(P)-dependent dehydrogenase (short-subunit alcohol dehydrogenase family)/rhamnose utilization protein RhaD (predicted bifunctional aldolase and dehydrogenase)